jgi:two-component system, OmpR family, phosphate regulon sensor histidine kinase PhoR
VNRLLGRLIGRPAEPDSTQLNERRLEAERGRALIEESREIVVVLDAEDRVLAASRRARESFAGLERGDRVPQTLLSDSPLVVRYDVDGREERLLYVRETGHMAAYEELRAGFTAAVSHELRTPLARLLALLETAGLPGSDTQSLVAQAQNEVGLIRELIDDVLFLSELESGRELVALGTTPGLAIVREVAAELAEQAERAAVGIEVRGDEAAEVPLRPRMLRVIVANLAENAFRYAGPDATLTLSLESENGEVVLAASDDGAGVGEADLIRLFERFYRADRARASRGTGLGLAIVKHIVTSAGGRVEASGAPGGGLTVRCVFPAL